MLGRRTIRGVFRQRVLAVSVCSGMGSTRLGSLYGNSGRWAGGLWRLMAGCSDRSWLMAGGPRRYVSRPVR